MNRNLFIILATVVVAGLIGLFVFVNNNSTQRTAQENSSLGENTQAVVPGENETPGQNLQRDPNTKMYESKTLGVRFYYLPQEGFPLKVTETGNKIYLHGERESLDSAKMIEVFTKAENVSFADAIKDRFLKNYSPQDCFVKVYDTPASEPQNRRQAGISYPPPTGEGEPFWQNASKCPEAYAETNAVRYFLHDTNEPTKYLFLDLGQDSIASDGTAATSEGGRDWSRSIEIF